VLVLRCERCEERYGLPEAGTLIGASEDGVPRCTTPGCGYPLRPEGTLWGETLPRAAVERAWELAADADAFIVLDSDLRTAPISLLPSVPLTRGVPLVLVGETPTQYDRYAARGRVSPHSVPSGRSGYPQPWVVQRGTPSSDAPMRVPASGRP